MTRVRRGGGSPAAIGGAASPRRSRAIAATVKGQWRRIQVPPAGRRAVPGGPR
ncbi:hypothetical protein ACGF5C_11360 [Micromonospora sp. NPDC047620]|uniref:hypothetical protein n=1 Tax=Micromonospora sp. NPDC047620 TaxID=3364251 RepID=UPI0037231D95